MKLPELQAQLDNKEPKMRVFTASILALAAIVAMGTALPAWAEDPAQNTGAAPQDLDQTAGAGSDRATSPDHGTPTAGQPHPATATQAEADRDVTEADAVNLAAADSAHAMTCPCPMCPGKKSADKTGPAAYKRTMLMDTEISANDPGALLALRDELNLTSDQVRRLEDIQRETRNEVKEVLNSEQQQKLAGVADQPISVHRMHSESIARMNKPGTEPGQGPPEVKEGGIDTDPNRNAALEDDTDPGESRPGKAEF